MSKDSYFWWLYMLPAFGSILLKYIYLLPDINLEWQVALSNHVLQSIYYESPDALFVVDVKSKGIIDCNPAALKMFDADKVDQLIGRKGEDLHVEKLSDYQRKHIENSEYDNSVDIEYKSLKGRKFWGSLSFYHTVYNHNGLSIVRIADITKQKQALNLVKYSEAIFTLLDDTSPITIWMADADMLTQLLEINIEFWPSQAIFEKKLNNKNALFGLLARIHQDDKEIFYHVLVRAIRKKEEFRLELRMKDSQGVWKWMLSTGMPRIGIDTESIGYIGCFLDINDRFELKDELDQLFSLSLDAIVVVGLDGFIVRHNPAFTVLLGYSNDIFMSRPFISFFHSEDQALLTNQLKQILQGNTITNLEIKTIDTDGNEKWLLLKAMPNLEKNQVFFVIQDNTESFHSQKQKQELIEQIKYVNALMDTLFLETAVGLCYFDLDGNYMRINKSLAHQNGLTVEDHTGKNLHDIVPDIADSVLEDIRRVASQQTPYIPNIFERVSQNKNEPAKYFSVNYFQIRVQNKLIGVGASSLDISAIKHAQMEVEQLNLQLISQAVLLDQILLTIPDMILLTDNQGYISYVNQAVCDFTGKTKAYLTSKIECNEAGFDQDFYNQVSKKMLYLKENHLSKLDGSLDIHHGTNNEKNFEYTLLVLDDKNNNLQGMLATFRDITKQRIDERIISNNQKQLNQIINLLPQPIYMIDSAGIVQMANKSYAALCDLTIDEIINNAIIKFVHFEYYNTGSLSDGLPKEEKNYNNDSDNNRLNHTYIWESEIEQFQGVKQIYQVCKQNFISSSNKKELILYVATDITQTKNLQLNLQKRECFLQQIIQNIPQAIFIKDAEGKYLLVNKAYLETYKKKESEIINFTDFDFNPDHRAASRFAEVNKRVLEDNQTFEGEDYYLETNGEKRYFHVLKKPFSMSSNSDEKLLLGVISDITTVKKLHLEIQYNEDFLRQVINLVPHGIFIKNQNGKYLLVNTAFTTMLRTNSTDLTQKSVENLFPNDPEIIERQKKYDAQTLQSKSTQTNYQQVYDPIEQKLRYFQDIRRPIRFKPQDDMLILGVIVEITDMKNLETTIKQNFDVLNKVVQSMPIAIFVKDNSGKIILANQLYADIHNQNLEQIIGHLDSEYLDIEIQERVYKEDQQIIENKQKRVYERIYYNKKLMQMRKYIISKSAIQLEIDGPWLMIGSANDIGNGEI